ncbi:MAG TPA: cation transporter [Flavobacterium sp.]|nr:cation transporter [Flavobacterium sp.]
MRILFLITFMMLTSFTVNAQVQKAVIKTTITCDHCKECETCGQLFEKKLIRQKGVQMVALNEKEMTITVFFNAKKTDLPTIRTAISQLGYDADDVKADPKAYEALDGCCKV